MKRIKVGQGYNQSGAGLGFLREPNVYLIDGKLWAKNTPEAAYAFRPSTKEMNDQGYIAINAMELEGQLHFHQNLGSSINAHGEVGAHTDFNMDWKDFPQFVPAKRVAVELDTFCDMHCS